MDDIRQKLNNAFTGFSYEVEDGRKITVRYHWDVTIDGIASICVSLCGKDPLTGEAIKDEEITRLSPTKLQATSRAFPYDGLFFLRFDALDREGRTVVEDFRKREKVRLVNESKSATVSYAAQSAKRGWTKLTIHTNCPSRCSGNLWAFFDGSYQMIPPLKDGENVLYLPTTSGQIQLVFDEAGSDELQPINCVVKG